MQDQAQAGNQGDGYRKWLTLAAVAVGIFMATLDASIVNIAMPTLEEVLATEFHIVQWVTLSYLLTLTTLMLGFGRLADIIGKRAIYTTGFVIFTLGSWLCGIAAGVEWLIGFRVVQGLGAAMILALGPAIITEAFPARQRGLALGLIGLAVSAGIITGPALGGVLLWYLSWHWIFLLNIPVGIVGTLMAAVLVPRSVPRGGQRFDYAGALTLFISLIALLLALTLGQHAGFLDPLVLLLFAVWLVFLVLFLAIEWRSSQPMVNLQLFRNIEFSISLITGFISFVLIAGVLFLIPFYLEKVLGYATLPAGLLLAVIPITLGIAAPISGWLADRVGARPIALTGLLVLTLGYVLISRLNAATTTVEFILLMLPLGLGMGIFQSPNNSTIMGLVPREQLGVASGLLAITRTLGQTTGIAVLNALWASRVFFHAGTGGLPDGPTAASVAAQVAGFQDAFLAAVALIGVALVLGASTWALPGRRSLPQPPVPYVQEDHA